MNLTRRHFGLVLARAGATSSRTFPGVKWESRTPGTLGLREAPLHQVEALLGGRGCVVKDGYVVHAWGDQAQIGDWLSSAKPVLSTLLFFAIAEGKVRSVDTRLIEFGWELERKDRSMSFKHLANMVSGYARPETPGSAWAYNDYGIQLYQMTLFDRVFREDPEAVAMSPRRLGCLQFEDGLQFRTNRRLWASVRDFCRIAWFWSNRGLWQNRQVLPRAMCIQRQKPQVPRDLPHTAKADTNDYLKIGTYGGGSDHFTEYGAGVYGFNWWFNATGRLHQHALTWPDAPQDTFMSIGAGGNCAVMIPSLHLILACAKGDWGKLSPGDPGQKTNKAIQSLVATVPKLR